MRIFIILITTIIFIYNLKSLKSQDIILEFENDYYENGLKYFEENDYKSALFEFRKAVIFDSTNLNARYYLSKVLFLNNYYDEGMFHIKKLLEKDSTYCDAYNYQSIYNLNILNDTLSALKSINKSIECNSDYNKSYFIRGNIYYFTQNYEKAISDYEKSLEIYGLDTVVLFNNALSHYRLKDYEGAIKNFNKLIVLNNENYNAILYRAFCFKMIDKEKESLNDLLNIKNVNQISSDLITINRFLIFVSIHFDNSIFVSEISFLKKFLDQNNELLNDVSSFRLITEHLYKSISFTNRKEIFNYLYDKHPNNILVRTAYADYLYFSEDRNNAIKEYNYCLKLDTKNGYYNYKIGMLYLQLNKMVSACKEFKKSRDLGYKPAYEYVYEDCN